MSMLSMGMGSVALVPSDLVPVHDQVVRVLLPMDVLALDHNDLVDLDEGEIIHVDDPEQPTAPRIALLLRDDNARVVQAQLPALAAPLLAVGGDVHVLYVREGASDPLYGRRAIKPTDILDKTCPHMTIEAR